MRDSFVFYRSYYEAIELLPKSQRADAYRAIFEYMFNGNDITDELKDTAKAIFLMAKPTLEASNKKYEAGKKGAEAKKTSKTKANDKQPDKQNGSNLTSKQQATLQANDKQPDKQNGSNVNVNDNVNDNVNVNEEEYNISASSNFFERYYKEILKLTKKLPEFKAEYDGILLKLKNLYGEEIVERTLFAALKDNFWRPKLTNPKSVDKNFEQMKIELLDTPKKPRTGFNRGFDEERARAESEAFIREMEMLEMSGGVI